MIRSDRKESKGPETCLAAVRGDDGGDKALDALDALPVGRHGGR